MKKTVSILLAMLLLISALAGCTQQPVAETPQQTSQEPQQEAPYTYADTIAWDGEYDVIVVGFGAAGASAAIAAADSGANVLLTEKAPEGLEGGNSRYCAQLFVSAVDYNEALKYYQGLRGSYKSTTDEILDVYVTGMMNIRDYLVSLGADPEQMLDWTDLGVNQLNLEYPEIEGGSGIRTNTVDRTIVQSALWNLLRSNVIDRSGNIDVWFQSPGKHLIQDPETKTILGVQIERQGELINVRANNGVVLSTGGFESNQEMVENYLSITHAVPLGTVFNTGDGITMAQEVGAELWHMSSWEGNGAYGGLVYESNRASGTFNNAFFYKGSVILVGPDGKRYMSENVDQRHGHVSVGGNWGMINRPEMSYVILDEAQRVSGKPYSVWSDACEQEVLDGILVKGDTLAELAEKLGIDAEGLETTVKLYNASAKSGVDHYGRTADSMSAIGDGPYYGLPMVRSILNTQGGPKRNENAEVIGVDGQPIPHLYSAGELGGVTAHKYQGGGNMAECVIFGTIAGQNAAAAKADLPTYTALDSVDSNIKYKIGSGMQNQPVDIPTSENEYVGMGWGMGGALYVKVTMNGSTIGKIEVVKNSETPGIGDKAIAIIPERIIEAQSAEVDTMTGATMTSKAIINGVQEAIAQAK